MRLSVTASSLTSRFSGYSRHGTPSGRRTGIPISFDFSTGSAAFEAWTSATLVTGRNLSAARSFETLSSGAAIAGFPGEILTFYDEVDFLGFTGPRVKYPEDFKNQIFP